MTNPEYCQNIYEAAQCLVKYWDRERYYTERAKPVSDPFLRMQIESVSGLIDNLKCALEGKDGKP